MSAARDLRVFIARRPEEVYAFASNPGNLPRWASGLGGAIRKDGDEWIAEGPAGRVRVRFADRNPFGILDHTVTLESGAKVHVPMRVIPHGDECEVVLTLFRQPGMSDETFQADAGLVLRDLETLKRLLERVTDP